MEGPKIASSCSRVSICELMGSHPDGPSRSDGISLMLSRLRRFDSRHSRFLGLLGTGATILKIAEHQQSRFGEGGKELIKFIQEFWYTFVACQTAEKAEY